jgi:hypothetical protein
VLGRRVQDRGGGAQGQPVDDVGVEQVAQPPGQVVRAGVGGGGAQVAADPVGDQGEPALRLQRLVECACGGYAWSVNRAWKTSVIPGTGGAQERVGMSGTYKTRRAPRDDAA